MGGGTSELWKTEKRPKVPKRLTLLEAIESSEIRTAGEMSIGTGELISGVPVDIEFIEEDLRKCDCCGEITIPISSRFAICSECGWQDDPEQKANPYLKNRSNKMSLQEAQRALAEGREIF